MINSIDIYNLRNGEYLQFLTDFLDTVSDNNPDNLQVRTAYDALRTATDDTEKLFKISQGSIITEDILALDARRDNALTGFTFLINGHSYSTDAAISAPAKTLGQHLAVFGPSATRDNYQSETATIRNIVNDWNIKPELVQAINTLQLNSWITELATANTAFNAAYKARTEEFGAASPDNLTAKRLEANAIYYKLRNTLNAHFTLTEGSEPYATTIQTINAYIDQYNKLLTGRTSKPAPAPVAPATV